MSISSEKVIDKMIVELQKAKTINGDLSKVKIHLEKVQVLNELLLDESSTNKEPKQLSQQMIEHLHTDANQTQVISTNDTPIGDQGSSIFDF